MVYTLSTCARIFPELLARSVFQLLVKHMGINSGRLSVCVPPVCVCVLHLPCGATRVPWVFHPARLAIVVTTTVSVTMALQAADLAIGAEALALFAAAEDFSTNKVRSCSLVALNHPTPLAAAEHGERLLLAQWLSPWTPNCS